MPGLHIRRLERKSKGFVDAVVSEGTQSDARYWHQNVQLPYIAKTTRLDRTWNWPRLVPWTAFLERMLLRNAVFFQLSCSTPSGTAFPVGQILVSDGYPFFPNHGKPSIFLWYLAAAPNTVLTANGLPPDLKLMRPLVDIAVQFSFQRAYNGRLTLHAAASGNLRSDKDLYDKYEKGCKLIPFAKPSLIISLVRRNDGRYFYADEQRALDLTVDLDYLR